MRGRFNLIELIVVIAVLGILFLIIIPNIGDTKQKSNIAAVKSNIKNLQIAVDLYKNDNGECPSLGEVSFGEPKEINQLSLFPMYLKSFPKTTGAKYWVDNECTVYGSFADLPKNISSNSVVTWDNDENANEYKIYNITDKKESVIDTNAFEPEENKKYLISSIDKNDLDTPYVSIKDNNDSSETNLKLDFDLLNLDSNGSLYLYSPSERQSSEAPPSGSHYTPSSSFLDYLNNLDDEGMNFFNKLGEEAIDEDIDHTRYTALMIKLDNIYSTNRDDFYKYISEINNISTKIAFSEFEDRLNKYIPSESTTPSTTPTTPPPYTKFKIMDNVKDYYIPLNSSYYSGSLYVLLNNNELYQIGIHSIYNSSVNPIFISNNVDKIVNYVENQNMDSFYYTTKDAPNKLVEYPILYNNYTKDLTNIKQEVLVSTGEYYRPSPTYLDIMNNNELWATGYNDYGSLGTGNVSDYVPYSLVMNNVSKIDYGIFFNGSFTAALKNDHTLWTFGSNQVGSLCVPNYYGSDEGTSDQYKVSDNVKDFSIESSKLIILKQDNSLWASTNDETTSLTKVEDNVSNIEKNFDGEVIIRKTDNQFYYENQNLIFKNINQFFKQEQLGKIKVLHFPNDMNEPR